MNPLVSHLEGAIDGARLPAGQLHATHQERPIVVRYDLEQVKRRLTKQALAERDANMWRYRELLPAPLEGEPVSLGEGRTPLLSCRRLARELGLRQLWIKDESQLPTGSFKSRGMAMALTMARHFGVRRIALPSAGNAGGAAAAYAARAGIEAFVFMPHDTPIVNFHEARLANVRTFMVDGLINDCGRLVKEGAQAMGWFDLSTLKEPYRLEGKKTMGLELAEQFAWSLPDVIVYPTGGGTGLIGMWKAFAELAEMGWLESDRLPRMVAVQADGCAPIPRAFELGERFATPPDHPRTIARGLRVPSAVGDFMILDAVRQSKGQAVAVAENSLGGWMQRAAGTEGIAVCPETAACMQAVQQLRESQWLDGQEEVVVFNTGAAQKYVEAMAALSLPIHEIRLAEPLDWNRWSEDYPSDAGTGAARPSAGAR